MRVYMRWGKTADTIMSEYASDIALDLHRRLQSVISSGVLNSLLRTRCPDSEGGEAEACFETP